MDCWESSTVGRSPHITTTAGSFTSSYHPSFSSSLLDAIYRSIDEQAEQADQGHHSTGKEVDKMSMYKKELSVDVRRPAMEERLVRRSADYRRRTARPAASSSSDSSCGSGFYSSENESVCYVRPAPPVEIVKAAPNRPEFVHRREDKASSTAKKTKKQPASPGARFAGFLNSLLASAKTAKVVKQAKKVRLSTSTSLTAEDQLPSPAPSSASSRSCLSKSGNGAASAGGKRSVRFYPVSVIVDEDSRPCGQKSLFDPSPSPPPATKYLTEELKLHIMEKNRRVEEAADRILNRYQSRTEILLRRESWASPARELDDSDDESDAASDVSSDLFELKNLGMIGAGAGDRYREELPVYETTNFVTNRAIAHGLIM